jgi:PHP family Zn ribbon phosphoesterase
MGSRDRLELIADRAEPAYPPQSPPFLQILPLAYVIADLLRVARDSKAVLAWQERLVAALGDERHVLTEAAEERIAEVATAQLARAIIAQRTSPPGRLVKPARATQPSDGQLGLFETI